MPTLHILVKGEVQGVFFRASAKTVADKNSITGWIKNTAEGHVEVLASGPHENLEIFTEWCRKGPSRARVQETLVTEMEEQPFNDFQIRRS